MPGALDGGSIVAPCVRSAVRLISPVSRVRFHVTCECNKEEIDDGNDDDDDVCAVDQSAVDISVASSARDVLL